MASFQGTRFPGPMFNQNFINSSFNMNPPGDGHPRPQFQRPPSAPYGPIQPPERFIHGQFQNRPQFSNFPEPVGAAGFRTRLPPPNQVFGMGSPPPNKVFRMSSPPPSQPFRMKSPTPNPAFRMQTPPPNPAFRMQSPPNQGFRVQAPPPPNQGFHVQVPPPPNQGFPVQAPPPPLNQAFRAQVPSNQAFRVQGPPNQAFRMNMPPSGPPRPRFPPFQRPFRPWNPMSTFSGPKASFQNRPLTPVQSHQPKDLPLQANKKRRQKTREFRKLKSWMTDELFLEVKKKNTLYLKAKSSDEQTAWQEFRLQRNRVSSLIKEAKIKAGLISRKIKEEDNTEKPFSCDTCDRAFVTEGELQDHFSQHIKCTHANCLFEAHPKIVTLHQKLQHDTGYADRINKLKDDEEIRKWREERKRRFPTAENIKKRKAEQAEKEARGEVLETKEFGKFKRRRENSDVVNDDSGRRMRNHGRNRRPNRRRNFRNHAYSQPLTMNVDSESDSDSDSHITLKPFVGVSSLTNSALEIAKNDDVNVASNPQVITDTFKKNNTCEQNLSKSHSDQSVRESHADADNNSNNGKSDDQTSFLVNGNTVQECVPLHTPLMPVVNSSEDVSIVEECTTLDTPLMNADNPSKVPVVEECTTLDTPLMNVGNPSKVPVVEELMPLADESVCEIPASEIESVEPEVVSLQDSDDESPECAPIIKSVKDCDSGDESPECITIIKPAQKPVVENGKILEKSQRENFRKINERQTFNGDKSNKGLQKEHTNQNGFSNGQENVFQARKSTLLEKLLADDIRHERNVILQCARYIVNNNFFGIGQKKL